MPRSNGGLRKIILRTLGLLSIGGAVLTSFFDIGGPRYLPFVFFSLAVLFEWELNRTHSVSKRPMTPVSPENDESACPPQEMNPLAREREVGLETPTVEPPEAE